MTGTGEKKSGVLKVENRKYSFGISLNRLTNNHVVNV